jgi:hypothetical protein
MNLKRNWIVLCAAVASCAVSAEPAAKSRVAVGIAPPARIPYPSPAAPAGESIPISAMPREVRRAVVADAARRFKVAQNAVVLARAEKMHWSDASLGCPEPGRQYAQAIVPGFRVAAKTAEGEFLYHTDAHGRVLVCEPSQAR